MHSNLFCYILCSEQLTPHASRIYSLEQELQQLLEQKRRISEDVCLFVSDVMRNTRIGINVHYRFSVRSQNSLLQSELRSAKAMEAEAHQSLLAELARRDDSIARLQRDLLQLQEARESLLSEVSALSTPILLALSFKSNLRSIE